MAGKRPVYFTMHVTRNNFPRFRRKWENATRQSLLIAGREGRDVAKATLATKQKHRGTKETWRSISFNVRGKIVAITVGTLKGVFVERGTKERVGPRGSVEAYKYLAAGGKHVVKVLPAAMRARMNGRL